MFCHVTLHWENYAPALRRKSRTALASALDEAVAIDNPAAVWLLGFSGLVFGGITVLVAFLVLFYALTPARSLKPAAHKAICRAATNNLPWRASRRKPDVNAA